MTGRLDGKVALVTGAASGIGRATVLAFLREGARVAATDLRLPDFGGDARQADLLALVHDVTDERAWADAVAATCARFGALDILVNNAGIGGTGEVLTTTLEAWRRVMAVNLEGVFLGTREAIAAMQNGRRDQAGSIVNVSSILGLVGSLTRASAYSASKGAVRLFSKSAALECAGLPRPIRVNSVHPGYIDTPLVAGRLEEEGQRVAGGAEALRTAIVARHPIGRLGRAEDIAAGIVYLASEEAAFVTGAELVIDGGYTAQ